jgi:hypothetical protein
MMRAEEPRLATVVTPLRPARPSRDDDFVLRDAPDRPVIKPGCYEARSSHVRRAHFWSRHYLEVLFTVFEGSAVNGAVLATGVPAYFTLSSDGRAVPGPGSELARLLQLFRGTHHALTDGVRLGDLKAKLWMVEIGTVTTDKNGRPLAEASRYSKVLHVVERIA